ncbi:gonadotropin subunit beta-1-like [Polymixia lowei]
MQLVVMAALLALAEAGQVCSFGCRPTNVSITVESCGRKESVDTTICAGQCYQQDPVYLGQDDWPKQETCNGEWSYEVKHIEGCPVGITYPVAKDCMCTTCETGNTYCGRFPGDMPNCLSY